MDFANKTLESLFRISEFEKKGLNKLNIKTVFDLLFHFPVRYSDMSEIKSIESLENGESATIYGRIVSIKTKKSFKGNIPIGEVVVEDQTGKIKAVWFNQVFVVKTFLSGEFVKLSGRVSIRNNEIYLANPEIEKKKDLAIDTHKNLFGKGDIDDFFNYPVYTETKGISSKWIYHHIKKIFLNKEFSKIKEYIPKDIIEKYNLPELKTALIWIHTPQKKSHAMASRKRFAFEEIFLIQLKRQADKIKYQQNGSFLINTTNEKIDSFLERFPFSLTKGQNHVWDEIRKDISSTRPMSRLLEGDVGSGKTAIAAVSSFAVVFCSPKNQNFGHLQVAYMAPTEILAVQLFESFIKYFENTDVQIGLLTSSGCRKFPSKISTNGESNWTKISKNQLLKWVSNGEIPILIGTHSLIQKKVAFKNLAFVIIDEQHRFGTRQRSSLVRKGGIAPHLLSMTATPIPRTLALTIYGDLDLSVLSEMPVGRKKVITKIVSPLERESAYERARTELDLGHQVYVICPRIEDPDKDKERTLTVKSAISEAVRLKREVFPKKIIGVLHSKMTKQKKEDTMALFSEGKIDILVATSVVEVGVNVPNATVIIIEGSERFGLAQLHQLRGRVIRSSDQAYCFLFVSDSAKKISNKAGKSKTIERLNALTNAENGFELAELDLSLRGTGELSGSRQWGISDLAMEALRNPKLVSFARDEALNIVERDTDLLQTPLLKEVVENKHTETHFE